MKNDRLLLSVIIPVYNVASWLPACLQSIADQTLPPSCFEVLLTDDASTDGSQEICREFCSRYSNFRCIALKEHTPGGAAIPVNRALDQAQGTYISMIDSDDFIEPDTFAVLLHRAQETGADMVFFNYRIWYEQEQRYAPAPHQGKWELLCQTERAGVPFRDMQQKALLTSVTRWNKLYRREFLEAFHIRNPEGDFVAEDNVLHWYCVVQARSITTVDRALLTHRIGRAGQLTRGDAVKRSRFVSDHAGRIQEFLKRIHRYEEFRTSFFCWYLNASWWIFPRNKRLSKDYLRQLQQRCPELDWAQLQVCRRSGTLGMNTIIQYWFMLHGYWRTGWLAGWCVARAGRLRNLCKELLRQGKRRLEQTPR